MSSPLLEIRNLSTKFTTEAGDVVAVNDIGFSINRSETIGIVGESGSGKSVTALSIMRLLSNNGSITAGKIDFFR
ncbi:MAG: ATP-binding cassette domain-containing protein [Bacteroidetes bacterium]|nr:ATP-binding cassette domain-containing protein [Bacteroidota bacterium]